MRKLIPIFLAIALLLVAPSLVLAQEAAKYNFASSQGSKELKVVPGGEGWGVIYFYNIDGNRITHITLDVSQAPTNWDIEIRPSQHELETTIGGMVVTTTGNLHVRPSELLPGETEAVPEDMVCIKIPDRGYALAKPAYIIIKVPESEEIGSTGDILISAEAEWLGQGGAAAIKQARNFQFTVRLVSNTDNSDETITGNGNNIEAADLLKVSSISTTGWLPGIIAAVLIIAVAVLISYSKDRKRR